MMLCPRASLLLLASVLATGCGSAPTPVSEFSWSESPLVERRQIGTSVEGRPIDAFRVTRAAPDTEVPTIFVVAGFHGHENSERDAYYLIDRLTRSEDQPGMRELLERTSVWFVPLANPDGRLREQRKNAREVDLNRNFPELWTGELRLDSVNYPGPEPFSEPESRAVRDFASNLGNVRLFIDMHRSAEVLVVCSTKEGRKPDPRSFEIAKELSPILEFPPGRVAYFGVLRGLAIDWARRSLDVPAIVWENPWDDRPDNGFDDPRWRGFVHLLRTIAND